MTSVEATALNSNSGFFFKRRQRIGIEHCGNAAPKHFEDRLLGPCPRTNGKGRYAVDHKVLSRVSFPQHDCGNVGGMFRQRSPLTNDG
jgi:hypothetical protein